MKRNHATGSALLRKPETIFWSSTYGFTLVDILVTLAVVSAGLLAIVALQGRGLQSTQDAYFKSQASAFAYDIAERMRVNAAQVAVGRYNTSIGASAPPRDCGAVSCNPIQMAAFDLYQWKERGVKVHLPDGDAAVDYSAPRARITIRWRGVSLGNCNASGKPGFGYSCLSLTIEP